MPQSISLLGERILAYSTLKTVMELMLARSLTAEILAERLEMTSSELDNWIVQLFSGECDPTDVVNLLFACVSDTPVVADNDDQSKPARDKTRLPPTELESSMQALYEFSRTPMVTAAMISPSPVHPQSQQDTPSAE